MAGNYTRLIPDGMFLVRHVGKGMMNCFVEVDMGTMSERQWRKKLQRYEVWSQSEQGNRWLNNLYASHGATSPRPEFRVFVVANEERRKMQLVDWSQSCPVELKKRIWFTSVPILKQGDGHILPIQKTSIYQIIL